MLSSFNCNYSYSVIGIEYQPLLQSSILRNRISLTLRLDLEGQVQKGLDIRLGFHRASVRAVSSICPSLASFS
jgi:hypothetical protein